MYCGAGFAGGFRLCHDKCGKHLIRSARERMHQGLDPEHRCLLWHGKSGVNPNAEIDGSPVKPEGWRSHCFPPGKHQIGFLADSANAYEGFRVADYVDLELAPLGKCVLRGDFEGINLVLHILDVGRSPETVTQELKFKISSSVQK